MANVFNLLSQKLNTQNENEDNQAQQEAQEEQKVTSKTQKSLNQNILNVINKMKQKYSDTRKNDQQKELATVKIETDITEEIKTPDLNQKSSCIEKPSGDVQVENQEGQINQQNNSKKNLISKRIIEVLNKIQSKEKLKNQQSDLGAENQQQHAQVLNEQTQNESSVIDKITPNLEDNQTFLKPHNLKTQVDQSIMNIIKRTCIRQFNNLDANSCQNDTSSGIDQQQSVQNEQSHENSYQNCQEQPIYREEELQDNPQKMSEIAENQSYHQPISQNMNVSSKTTFSQFLLQQNHFLIKNDWPNLEHYQNIFQQEQQANQNTIHIQDKNFIVIDLENPSQSENKGIETNPLLQVQRGKTYKLDSRSMIYQRNEEGRGRQKQSNSLMIQVMKQKLESITNKSTKLKQQINPNQIQQNLVSSLP